MMSATPRVSIGLPVYNGQRYLEHAVRSLLEQTFADFELILSDNGSTDDTPSLCQQFVESDPRVRFYRSPENQGCAWNYNRVFQLSRGEYFKWAAHDDVCGPEFLERCVRSLDECPEAAWCHPRTTHIGPSGRTLEDPRLCDISYLDVPEGKPTRASPRPSQRFRAILFGAHGEVDFYGLIRTKTLRKTALHLPYYGADKVLVAELALHGPFCEVPETLFFVRAHTEGSGWLQTAEEQHRFVDTRPKSHLTSTRLNLLVAYLGAIRRAELGWRERTACYAAIVEYLFQVRKWGSVLRKCLGGTGTGGGYRDLHEQIERDLAEKPEDADSAEHRDANCPVAGRPS